MTMILPRARHSRARLFQGAGAGLVRSREVTRVLAGSFCCIYRDDVKKKDVRPFATPPGRPELRIEVGKNELNEYILYEVYIPVS